MKLILSFFLLVSSACFSYSEDVFPNLRAAWGKHDEAQSIAAIDILTVLIDDEHLSLVDKVHYIYARSMINLEIDKIEEYIKDIKILKNLSILEADCDKEIKIYYNHILLCPIPL